MIVKLYNIFQKLKTGFNRSNDRPMRYAAEWRIANEAIDLVLQTLVAIVAIVQQGLQNQKAYNNQNLVLEISRITTNGEYYAK